MPGRDAAPANGRDLEEKVRAMAFALGLTVHGQVQVGRRLWGARRVIDLILTDGASRRSIGIECKFQGTGGSVEEKIPATIDDIAAWPIPGLVVFEGDGFTANMRSYLISTGKAVEAPDLEPWLRLYFGLPLPERLSARRLARTPRPSGNAP